MKSYSQSGEDVLVAGILNPAERHGRVLEIGAWNATEFSNSRLFIEAGWDAVLIEPSPGPMHGLVKEYGQYTRVALIQACVSIERGLLRMQITDDAVSTPWGSPTHAEWSKGNVGGYFGVVFVPSITFPELANQFGGFDFVSIDAEGLSVDLCAHMLALEQYPPVICCEYDSRLPELLNIAGRHGYHVPAGGTNGTNVILARK